MARKTSRRKRIGAIPKRRNERLKYNYKNKHQSNQQDSNAHDVDDLSNNSNSKNGTNDYSKTASSHQSSSSILQNLPALPAYILEHDYAGTSAKTLENIVPEDSQLPRELDSHQESVPENKEEVPLQELVLNVKEKLKPFLPRTGFTPIFNFYFP